MDLIGAALICLASLLQQCEGGYFALYGGSFSILYNHTSASIASRRFPDQNNVNLSDYQYFSRDVNAGGIFTGENLVVGAKNALYHFDFNLTMQSVVTWDIDSAVEAACISADNPMYICQNHIRTFQKIPSSSNRLLVCGTQGDQTPQCVAVDISGGILGARSSASNVPDGLVSHYIDSPGFGEFIDAMGTGTGNMDNRYFSAAFRATNRDFLMSYQSVNYNPSSDPPLSVTQSFRTRAADNFWLRSPVTFVDYYRADYSQVLTAGDREYYFVFLRENFQIIRNGIPLEIIYSRVVRLCRNDVGSTANNYFTSFVKARIFCDREAPSDNRSVNTIDFQYNVITTMAFNSGGRYHETGIPGRAMYGAFVTSGIGPIGSAVCIYGAEISSENGIYAVYTHDLLDYSGVNPPNPEPNTQPNCDGTRNDINARYRVESTSNVAQIGESPILVLDQYTITQMVVDNLCIIRSSSSTACADQDILLLGTDMGTILKVSFATTASRQIDPVIAEEIHLDDNNPIKELKFETINSQKVLFATTDSKIYRVPLARCSRHNNMCSDCISARDPYCVWNTDTQRCEVNTLASSQAVVSNFRQNVHTQSSFPVVTFSQEVYAVSEGDTTLTVTLNMDSAASGDVMVEVTSVDETAKAGEDYTAVNRVVTIPTGQVTATFNVIIARDDVLEGGNETLTLNLQGRGTVCVITGEPAAVVIQDSDSATLSLVGVAAEVGEADGAVNLTVSLSVAASDVDINFYISATSGTATASEDFCGLFQQRFTFEAGSVGSLTISIPIVNDDLLEDSETFTVTLSLANNPGLGSRVSVGNSQVTVTIRDNDGLQFGFDAASFTTVEGDTTTTLSLRVLKIGSNQIPVTVSANLVPGTATSGTDFSFTAASVVFDSSTIERVVQVSILGDTSVESEESFGVALTTNTARVTSLNGRGTATIYIQDNDVMVEFTVASRNVSMREDAGSVVLTVAASGSLAQPVNVSYATRNGLAIAPLDYTAASGTLQLTSLTPTGDIIITIADNTVYERDVESFSVELSTSGGNVQLQNNVATVNILDNDVAMVEFVSSSRTVGENEGVGTVTLSVQLSGGSSSDEPIPVSYRTMEGEATADLDYTSTSGMFQLSASTGMGTISVTIIDDKVYEKNIESFTVVLSADTCRVQVVNNIATVSITDNDDEALTLVHSGSVMENGSFVALTVTKSIANEIPVNFVISTVDDSARGYSDYAPLSSMAFSFLPGNATSEVFRVAIVDDNVVENSESFTVQLTSTNSRVSVVVPQSIISITDNDALVIGFECPSYTANEGSSLPVKIVKQGYSALPVSVTVNSVGSTASLSDYSLQSQTVTFAADETEQLVYVNILTDDVFEGMEDFNLTLQSNDGRVQLSQNQAMITIRDLTALGLAFDRSEYVIMEDGGAVNLSVSRSPVTLSTSVTVQLWIIPQTAIDGMDYNSGNSNLTIVFSPGSSDTDQVSISIVNDNIFEMLNETFVVIMDSDDPDVSVPGIALVTVVVMDDDILEFGFETLSYTASEGSVVSLKIVKQGSSDLPVTIIITSEDITASPNDYSFQPTNVTFAAGQTEQTISLNIVSDVELEGSERFNLILQSNDARVLIGRSPAMITIQDVSVVGISFVQNEYSVIENAGNVDLLVSRTVASSIEVELQIIPQTAVAGMDYIASSPVTYTLSNPSRMDRIPIRIVNDDVLEMSSETFLVVLTSRDPDVSVQGMSTATVTIEDDDSNAFTFEQSTYAVMEGSTHLNLTIARTGEAAIPIELVLSTPDDSKDSSNYISSFKNTVVFQPSQQSVAVVIPIVDDSVKENTIDEFLLTLSPGPGTQSFRDRLSLGSSGTASAVVKVQDNDIDGPSVGGLGGGSCAPLTTTTAFISILAALLAVLVALVTLSVICLVLCIKRERYKTPKRSRRGVAPFGRETSTTVLGNLHTSEGSSNGSPSSSRSDTEVKTNLSKGGKSVKETNIDSTSGNTNHVIHTSSSAQSNGSVRW